MASSEIYNDRIYLDSILYFFSKKMYTISLKLYTSTIVYLSIATT